MTVDLRQAHKKIVLVIVLSKLMCAVKKAREGYARVQRYIFVYDIE